MNTLQLTACSAGSAQASYTSRLARHGVLERKRALDESKDPGCIEGVASERRHVFSCWNLNRGHGRLFDGNSRPLGNKQHHHFFIIVASALHSAPFLSTSALSLYSLHRSRAPPSLTTAQPHSSLHKVLPSVPQDPLVHSSIVPGPVSFCPERSWRGQRGDHSRACQGRVHGIHGDHNVCPTANFFLLSC
jgi:hypothetical protein